MFIKQCGIEWYRVSWKAVNDNLLHIWIIYHISIYTFWVHLHCEIRNKSSYNERFGLGSWKVPWIVLIFYSSEHVREPWVYYTIIISRYSVLSIYRGHVYRGIGYIAVTCWTPFFLRPKARYFSRNRGNTLDTIRGRQFFAKFAHRGSIVPGSLETIFREINSGLPVNAGGNTCCAMVSQARRSIDTSIVSQSRVRLIQCHCKSWLQIANLIINNV